MDQQIALLRLFSQGIADARFTTPREVVSWFGAVQAQDFLGALWAVGLRAGSAAEAEVERSVAQREIVRSWPLRGTLHFVAAEDLRWMLELLASRIIRLNAARMKRDYELDAAVFRQSRDALARAMRNGRSLTRPGLYDVLQKARIPTAKSRGLHIIFELAHEGFLCFGAREGKQPTFALLEEWVGSSRQLRGDEALFELARRYTRSHAPASAMDFAWWSGLPAGDARRAMDMVRTDFNDPGEPQHRGYLLPAFDEYLVAYKDRSAVLEARDIRRVNDGGGMLRPVVLLDGRVVGTWKRVRGAVEQTLFRRVGGEDRAAIKDAVSRYKAFLD